MPPHSWILLYFLLPWHAVALAAAASKPVRRLQAPHPDLSPSQQLRELAEIAKAYNINNWDVYGDFHVNPQDGDTRTSFLRNFEADVAAEFGKEDGVFMPSGVMAQSIALLIHHGNQQKQQQLSHKTKTFACHPTSHLLLHEQDGYKELCGFAAKVVKGDDGDGLGFGAPPMLLDHLEDTSLDEVSTLILELPHRELGGKLTPYMDIAKMREHLKAHKVAFHCDGARIFEASAGYGKSLKELAEPFDSVYISFYKGLGGMSGAMLMGDCEFCEQARVWLRRFGGNLFTLMPYIVSAWAGYQRHYKLVDIKRDGSTLMSFGEKRDKLCRIVVESLNANTDFAKVACFEPSTPQVNMVHLYLRLPCQACERIRDQVQESHGVSMFHRLRPVENGTAGFQEGYRSMMEISVGETNGAISDEEWIDSWSSFASQAIHVSRDA